MSEQIVVEKTTGEDVALAYADRMERGEVVYDPNLMALAQAVRGLRVETARLQHLLGLVGDTGKLEEVLVALRENEAMQQTISGLSAELSREQSDPHLRCATTHQLIVELAVRADH